MNAETIYEDARRLEQSGDPAGAAEGYRRAIEADPGHVRALNNLGACCERLGLRAEAEAAFRRALAAGPDEAIVHYNLARLCHVDGRLAEAEAGYRRTLALREDFVNAHFNLGRLLLDRGDPAAAEAELREVVKEEPDAARGPSTLGDALRAQQRLGEALGAYRRAAELAPEEPAAAFDVAMAHEAIGGWQEAIEHYRRCIVLEPTGAAAREGLARTLEALGRHDEAVASVREWLTVAPGQPVAEHVLASLGGAAVPPRASDAYVRETFDRFAPDFDTVLASLDYRAPRLLVAAIAAAVGAARRALDVLDLGCGTGLCAPGLAPFARRLEGVDLSAAMIARARTRGVYSALHEAELTRFLADQVSSWDVLASADTLCYFGDLAPVLRAARRALRSGGILAFTLERLDGASGHALRAHGRFAHARAELEHGLADAGFEMSLAEDVLRTEGGVAVAGWIVTARAAD